MHFFLKFEAKYFQKNKSVFFFSCAHYYFPSVRLCFDSGIVFKVTQMRLFDLEC